MLSSVQHRGLLQRKPRFPRIPWSSGSRDDNLGILERSRTAVCRSLYSHCIHCTPSDFINMQRHVPAGHTPGREISSPHRSFGLYLLLASGIGSHWHHANVDIFILKHLSSSDLFLHPASSIPSPYSVLNLFPQHQFYPSWHGQLNPNHKL